MASDGRCSDVWSVWTSGNDVYLAPRLKGGEFKISLHGSGKWRLAFTNEYIKRMPAGTWEADRRFESLERTEQAPGFSRAGLGAFSRLRTSPARIVP